jgi:hypothetical protein
MNEEIFTIKIDYKNPIDLQEFSESFSSIAQEFKTHIHQEGYNLNEDQLKLYIYEIEKGSIIAKMKALTEHVKTFDKKQKVIESFVNKTKNVIEYFLNQVDLKPELNIEQLQNYKKIIQPAASDNGTSLAFSAAEGATQNINLTINNVQANAIQNKIDHEIGLLKLPENAIQKKVLFYCYQARNDKKAKTGDMGIIESISPNAVKT